MRVARSPDLLLLDEWEAVPIAARLREVEETRDTERPWSPIRVPGHWQLEKGFKEYQGRVLYRCRFRCRNPAAGEMVSLRFGGVYYAARVWLNGNCLGGHEGYFAPFEFDCTDAVSEKRNELLVEVSSPEEPDENAKKTIGGAWAGWDGMDPRINPGGIFREVALVYGSEVRIRSLGMRVDPSGSGRVVLDVYSRRGCEAEITGLIRPLGFEAPGVEIGETVQVVAGRSRVVLRFFLPKPRLWWTWDRGEQPLYELVLRCAGDERRVRFGVRSLILHDWKVYLNGERVFLRGVNYLPTDAYPATAPEERLRADAALVREANMNAVRVHAHVAEAAFYEACDELGVLILQDFPLQWTHRRSVLGPAVEQAGEMAGLLQSHPSVGVYLAHDEPFYVAPPEKWSVFGLLRTAVEVLAPRWALWQRRVLGPAVVGAIEKEDPSRPVIDAAGHPLTTNHLYFGWYYGKFRDLERVVKLLPGLSRFPTEYGAQALPDPESLAEIWPDGREPDWEVLSRFYRLQTDRMRRYVPWKGDRARYVLESQVYQAEVLKHATELFRRRKYLPTGGTFAFMLNDPAPAISWSVVDWRRRTKAAYEALAAAMSPVLMCAGYPQESYAEGETVSLPLFVVNDLARRLGRLRWSWDLSLGGSVIASGSSETEAPADSVVEIGRVCAKLPSPGRATLRLKLAGGAGNWTNGYEFEVRAASRAIISGTVTKR